MLDVQYFISVKDKLISKISLKSPLAEWVTIEDRNETDSNYIGLLKALSQEDNEKDDDQQFIFYKSSKFPNQVHKHESLIFKSVEKLSYICPHFARMYTEISAEQISSVGDNSLTSPSLLLEYYEGNSLGSLITSQCLTVNQLFSVIMQVFMAIKCGRMYCNFSHNDLHPYNIQIVPCDKDLVFVYSFSEDNCVYVPSIGVKAIMIDYEYSYTDDILGKQFNGDLSFITMGYNSVSFDPIADIRVFLLSVTKYMKESYNSTIIKLLRNKVKKVFNSNKVNNSNGRFKTKSNIYSDINKLILKAKCKSIIFNKLQESAVSILFNSFVPLCTHREDIVIKDVVSAIEMLDTELLKIETLINSDHTLLTMMNIIVSCAVLNRDVYISDSDATPFRNNVLTMIDSKIKFFNVKGVNYEKILCAVSIISSYVENTIHNRVIENQRVTSELMSKGVPADINSAVSLLTEVHVPQYKIKEITHACIIDMVNKRQINAKIGKYQDEINKIKYGDRGKFIFEKILSEV